MNDKLIQSSLEEESNFSSNIHGIDTITKDINTDAIKDYPIPDRYYKTQLVLLPVNKQTYYFYWDFPEYFFKEQNLSLEDVVFKIIDDNEQILAELRCSSDFGQYFYTLEKETKNIRVVALHNGHKLLESKRVKVFNTEIKYNEKDIWIEKTGKFTEVIRASMENLSLGVSSKSYIEEIRRLEEYTRSTSGGFSSDILGGK